jgi:hypothetical protein
MGKKSGTSVLKRQRELKKAEKAATKREKRSERVPEGTRVATRDDLSGYGFAVEDEGDEGEGKRR